MCATVRFLCFCCWCCFFLRIKFNQNYFGMDMHAWDVQSRLCRRHFIRYCAMCLCIICYKSYRNNSTLRIMYNWKCATQSVYNIKWCFNDVNSNVLVNFIRTFGQSSSLELIVLIKYVWYKLLHVICQTQRELMKLYTGMLRLFEHPMKLGWMHWMVCCFTFSESNGRKNAIIWIAISNRHYISRVPFHMI